MSQKSPLDKWRFLIGTWRSRAVNEFGEKGVVEGITTFLALFYPKDFRKQNLLGLRGRKTGRIL